MWLWSLWAVVAVAEESEFAGTEAPADAVEESETNLSAELSGTQASGNSVFYTVNGAVSASHKWGKNKVAGVGSINVGKAVADGDGDGQLNGAERQLGLVESARRYEAEGRYDRFFSERDSLYVLAGAFFDPFAGYDLRSHEQLGYSRIVVDQEETKFVGEIGVDVAQENYVDGVSPNQATVVAARGMMSIEQKIGDGVSIGDTVEVYESLLDTSDLRVLNNAALTVEMSTTFSLKLSHALIWDNVPVEGFQPLDQTTMATLVASIL